MDSRTEISIDPGLIRVRVQEAKITSMTSGLIHKIKIIPFETLTGLEMEMVGQPEDEIGVLEEQLSLLVDC